MRFICPVCQEDILWVCHVQQVSLTMNAMKNNFNACNFNYVYH